MSDDRPEREGRLGRRYPVDGVVAAVLVKTGRRRRRSKLVPAELVDLSVTGIGFVADIPAEVEPGWVLDFELASVPARVRVRRISTDRDRGMYVGGEFAEPSPELVSLISRILTGTTELEKDRIWREGHLR